MRPLKLGLLTGLVVIFACAGVQVVGKYELASQTLPSSIRVGETLVLKVQGWSPEGKMVKNPRQQNLPTWTTDDPEHCRVEPRQGLEATVRGVAPGPCMVWVRAKVKVGLNEIMAWNGQITE